MENALAELPTDVTALQALVHQQRQENEQQQRRERALERENAHLRERLNILLAQRFGASSEKLPDGQLELFNEAEAGTADEPPEKPEPAVNVASHTRAKRGRRPLPESLPRVEVIHDLPDEQKRCPHDGTPLEVIGAERSDSSSPYLSST
jgi:hypothetical protein